MSKLPVIPLWTSRHAGQVSQKGIGSRVTDQHASSVDRISIGQGIVLAFAHTLSSQVISKQRRRTLGIADFIEFILSIVTEIFALIGSVTRGRSVGANLDTTFSVVIRIERRTT